MTGSVVDMAPFWAWIAAPAATATLAAAGYVLAAWKWPALRTPVTTFRLGLRDVLWHLSDRLCASRHRPVFLAGRWIGELGWLIRPVNAPWRVVCWLLGHKTLALGPSPPEGWWCWRCYQAVHTRQETKP